MKKILILTVALAAMNASAVLYTSGTLNSVIPDGDTNGWANTITVPVQPGTMVDDSLSVILNLSGGWNGDLYAYLVHDTGFTELLNRVGTGVGGAGTFGYGDSGMNVTLSGTGSSIHLYGGTSTFSGVPSGPYMADGTGMVSFNGLDPSGTWTLFIADLNGGGVTTVQSWGLQMDIVAVPEIETWIAAALAGAFGAFWLNRQIWSGVVKVKA